MYWELHFPVCRVLKRLANNLSCIILSPFAMLCRDNIYRPFSQPLMIEFLNYLISFIADSFPDLMIRGSAAFFELILSETMLSPIFGATST